MPSRCAERMIRHAISPRFAIRILVNIEPAIPALRRPGQGRAAAAEPGPIRRALSKRHSVWVPAFAGTTRGDSLPKSSHPENPELGLPDRRVEAGRDGERQDTAGIGRIDDAVVPQPRARIIGMPLRLVLGADRRLEGFLLLAAPALP